MSLVLIGTNFIVTVFVLMGLNGVFAFAKIPLLAIPLGFLTWIIFFAFSLELSAINFILILITLLFASASIIMNIKEVRG